MKNNNKSEPWERIEEVMKYYRLNKNSFSDEIGMSNNVTIGRILNEKRKPIRSTLEKIVARFPQINMDWLLTGEGEMLIAESNQSQGVASDNNISRGKLIPLYDAEAAAGTQYGVSVDAARQIGVIEIGGLLRDSEAALRVYGNSMVPNYPSGCILGLRPHLDSFIEPGTVFVVETMDNRYLKRLFYNKDQTGYRCVSDNHVTFDSGSMKGEYCYPDFNIPFDQVRRLFRVVGVVKRNIL